MNRVAYGSLAVIATLVVLKNGWLSNLKTRIHAQTTAAGSTDPGNAGVGTGSLLGTLGNLYQKPLTPTNQSGEAVGPPLATNHPS